MNSANQQYFHDMQAEGRGHGRAAVVDFVEPPQRVEGMAGTVPAIQGQVPVARTTAPL